MKRKRQLKRIAVISAAVLVLLLVAVAVTMLRGGEDERTPETLTPEMTAWAEQESAEQPTETTVEPESTVYPEPEYDFNVDEITVEIEGLENEYDIAFINDVHMLNDHTSGEVTEDSLATVAQRRLSFSTADGTPSEELWSEIIKYLNYNDFDAVIFGGDIIDYCSTANIQALRSGLDELKYEDDRIMYLRSDHDYGAWYGTGAFTETQTFGLQSLVLDGDEDRKEIDLGEFVIVGINSSYRNFSEDKAEMLREQINQGKPVILASHVPFYSEVDDSLEELSMQVRNKIYYWSPDGSLYVPDEVTQGFIDEIYAEDSAVEQIVCAHMHAAWDGNVSETLKEHIFGPAYEGNIGVIHVKGEEKNETEKVEQ